MFVLIESPQLHAYIAVVSGGVAVFCAMGPAIHYIFGDLPPADVIRPQAAFESEFGPSFIPDDGREVGCTAGKGQCAGIGKSRPLTQRSDGLIPYISCHLSE